MGKVRKKSSHHQNQFQPIKAEALLLLLDAGCSVPVAENGRDKCLRQLSGLGIETSEFCLNQLCDFTPFVILSVGSLKQNNQEILPPNNDKRKESPWT